MSDGVWRSLVKTAAHAAVAPIIFPPLALLALVVGWATRRRQQEGKRPRIFWGPQPIIIIRDWSKAMRSRGYKSDTFVNNFFSVHGRSDFDKCRRDLYWPAGRLDSLKAYPALAEAMVGYDVFHFFFDGGLLGDTPFWWAEPWLLKLAGKKIVMSAYGTDIAVPGHLGPIEEAMIADYPWVITRAGAVRRKVDHFSRQADLVIETLQPGYLPRSDFLWINQFAIDLESCSVRSDCEPSASDCVTVIHAPNHRALKGTADLIRAVEELQGDGVDCQLQIFEKVSSDVLRAKVLEADIVVDQLLLGFGYFALESMSAGKPVISNIGWMSPRFRSTPSMRSCPIVDANVETISAVLRQLVEDARLRRTTGAIGREWILQFHSLDAVGHVWEGVICHVWEGGRLPDTGPPVFSGR